jgi:hypothetical protein
VPSGKVQAALGARLRETEPGILLNEHIACGEIAMCLRVGRMRPIK